jgi:hypothetical protein
MITPYLGIGTAMVAVTPPSGPGNIGLVLLIVLQLLVRGSYEYMVVDALE